MSVLILFILFCACLLLMKFTKKIFVRYLALFVFMALIIESLFFGYFLILISKGTCFLLIGNDKIIDNVIKTRLIYATYFAQGKKFFINQIDNDLGYTLGKDKETGLYKTNKQGFRANREYQFLAPKDKLRVATFGDSFVFCDDEKNEDAWPFVLENSVDNLEVLNFGVPGYGLGQSYLRYLKDGMKFNPDIVFINYVTMTSRDKISPEEIIGSGRSNLRMAQFYRVQFFLDNNEVVSRSLTPFDFFDSQFRKKYLYDEDEIFKTSKMGFVRYLSFCNTGLFLKESAARKILSTYAFKKEAEDQDLNINLKILENWIKIAKANGATILFFYQADYKQLPVEIQNLLKEHQSNVVYAQSAEAIDEQIKIHHAEGEKITNISNHYNAQGNKYYAAAVLKILKDRVWGSGSRIFKFDENTNSFTVVVDDK